MASIEYTAEQVGDRIRGFLESIFQHGGLQLTVAVADAEDPNPYFEAPRVVVRFSGRDVDLLLANRAEALLALEHLTMEALRVPSDGHNQICFDAQDYRMLRQEELRLSAVTAAEKVMKTHVPFTFGPMTSRERRIVHLALRDLTAVRSESAGFGPGRQVTVYPSDMPSGVRAAPPRPRRRR